MTPKWPRHIWFFKDFQRLFLICLRENRKNRKEILRNAVKKSSKTVWISTCSRPKYFFIFFHYFVFFGSRGWAPVDGLPWMGTRGWAPVDGLSRSHRMTLVSPSGAPVLRRSVPDLSSLFHRKIRKTQICLTIFSIVYFYSILRN